jgi:hypothetical protein
MGWKGLGKGLGWGGGNERGERLSQGSQGKLPRNVYKWEAWGFLKTKVPTALPYSVCQFCVVNTRSVVTSMRVLDGRSAGPSPGSSTSLHLKQTRSPREEVFRTSEKLWGIGQVFPFPILSKRWGEHPTPSSPWSQIREVPPRV